MIIPGVGKTLLVKSMAQSIGAEFKRIQFTPDLLPSDVTGVSIYNQQSQSFTFRPGPAKTIIDEHIMGIEEPWYDTGEQENAVPYQGGWYMRESRIPGSHNFK